MLKLKEVLAKYGVTKPTIYRWIKAGTFPAPVRIGASTVRWREEDLDTFDQARIKKEAQEYSKILLDKHGFEEIKPLPDKITSLHARGLKEQLLLAEGELEKLTGMLREDFTALGAEPSDFEALDFFAEHADLSRTTWNMIADVVLRETYEERKRRAAETKKRK